MQFALRPSKRDGCRSVLDSRHQPNNQVGGQKRDITGNGDDVANIRRMQQGPAHAGEDACQRPRVTGYDVLYHRQPQRHETPRITVGIEDQPADLWPQPTDNAAEHGFTTNVEQPLVATAHAARQPAGKNDAGRQVAFNHRSATSNRRVAFLSDAQIFTARDTHFFLPYIAKPKWSLAAFQVF
jgi:hypothetical protein